MSSLILVCIPSVSVLCFYLVGINCMRKEFQNQISFLTISSSSWPLLGFAVFPTGLCFWFWLDGKIHKAKLLNLCTFKDAIGRSIWVLENWFPREIQCLLIVTWLCTSLVCSFVLTEVFLHVLMSLDHFFWKLMVTSLNFLKPLWIEEPGNRQLRH